MADCVFCRIVSGDLPGHTVLETDDLVAFLDARPVFKGHVLLVPRTHVETLPDLPAEQRDGFVAAAQRLATAVKEGLDAQGSFMAINNTVSQSVPHQGRRPARLLLAAHEVRRRRGGVVRRTAASRALLTRLLDLVCPQPRRPGSASTSE